MNSKFSILLCFIFSLRLFSFTNSASLPSSMLDQFITAFNGNDCKMPEQIVLPNITKYVNSSDSIEENPYDLAVPLAVCAAKVRPDQNRDADLCNEVFEILTNISTCVLNNTVLQKIENVINITFEKEVCEGFSKYRNIFHEDPQFMALKLAKEDICNWYCSGGEISDACKFLLWSYRVQAKIYDQLKDPKDSNTQSDEIVKPVVPNPNEKEDSIALAAQGMLPVTEADVAVTVKQSESSNNNNIDLKLQTVGATLKTPSPSNDTNQKDAKSDKSQSVNEKHVGISGSNNPINTTILNSSTKTAIKAPEGMEKKTNSLSSNLTQMTKEPINEKNTLNKQTTVNHSSPIKNVTIQTAKKGLTVQDSDTLVKQTGNRGQNEKPVLFPHGKTTIKSAQSHNPPKEKSQGVDPALVKQTGNEGQNENLGISDQSEKPIKDDQLLNLQEEKPQDVDPALVKQTGNGGRNENLGISDQSEKPIKGDQLFNPQEENSQGVDPDPITKDMKNDVKAVKDNVKAFTNDAKMSKIISETVKNVASVMEDNGSTIKKETTMNDFADDKKNPSGSLEKSTLKDPSNQNSTNHPGGNKNGDAKVKPVKPAGEMDKEGGTKLSTSSEDAQAQLEEMEDGGDDDAGNFIDDGSMDDNFDSFVPKSDTEGDNQQEQDSNTGKAKDSTQSIHTIGDGLGQSQNSVQMDVLPDDVADGRSMNGMKPFPEQEDTHFFFYFLSIILVIIGSYLVFHNKQKIIALIIEGRHEKKRRSHNISYKKLETK